MKKAKKETCFQASVELHGQDRTQRGALGASGGGEGPGRAANVPALREAQAAILEAHRHSLKESL